jgi:hypothetical protein
LVFWSGPSDSFAPHPNSTGRVRWGIVDHRHRAGVTCDARHRCDEERLRPSQTPPPARRRRARPRSLITVAPAQHLGSKPGGTSTGPPLGNRRCLPCSRRLLAGAIRSAVYSSVQLYICSPVLFMTLAAFAPRLRQAVSKLVATLSAPLGLIASMTVRCRTLEYCVFLLIISIVNFTFPTWRRRDLDSRCNCDRPELKI